MNTSNWIAWPVVALMAVISIVLLMGKGGVIAGYNTSSKEKKAKVQ